MRGDSGKLVGMTGWLESRDLEEACSTLLGLGFEGVGVLHAQIGSRLIGAPVFDGHFAAVGNMIRESGLVVSTLNVIEEPPAFAPHDGPDARRATAARLSEHLRHAALMGAPGILIWDGRVDSPDLAAAASNQLAECIDLARQRAGLGRDEVQVSVELHPFTFALKYGRLGEMARALESVGAGVCVDFCHFAVALGQDFVGALGTDVMSAVTEIHYADSDCVTSEFHYPPERGVLDLAALEGHFAGRGLPASLDIFQWPAPISGARESMSWYRRFVAAQGSGESRRGVDAAP